MVPHQDVSGVGIHDFPFVRLYGVAYKSQMKHAITSYVVRDALLVGLYYVFKLLCRALHLVGFHVSFKFQIKHQIFLVPNKRETRSSLDNKSAEHSKTATYINNTYKITWSLSKEP